MSGLREQKKAATRNAIADAAALVTLRDGVDAATVSSVARLAGVSTRTFHNYFTSREDALLHFVVSRLRYLALQLESPTPGESLLDSLERLMVSSIEEGGSETLDSFATLYRLGEVLNSLEPIRAQRTLKKQFGPLFERIAHNTPGMDAFDVSVVLTVGAGAAHRAMESYFDQASPTGPTDAVARVRRAFAVIRSL
ncbi:TetR/AcrR family transcriptional regulator [Corynebacterium uberis]|uniref:TetR/AcrR family transcriptional regulator n=1 Tax=Corynebacterium TaxID=1716 RepID=UPI001D0BE1CD|nr:MULTISPECIES: TetR/AcrR family transcriptional regulator [Corynebacterium]MCZ9308812.1 TetR/AcrR family transcriptional regulator [Corynebacterium sp. c6VSa_13]UDL72660.1 TetR/AcrR family transcriptional regulator [Corynebacterium uberis]UDL76464.1 TetR/AcrR family transcriptional regulator [Corynebacterium uberis]UDL78676.1 TetR/AcrR family transcriptional regulator [Corynebacterium uberis]UDL80955.1 TetR/AcrR family transcriptional regulator [Corynebacterium uberis]